ncbi:hypothetical protein QUF72_20705 [Desulfobacterales bacterium HSG2]|nr:hypothetical protein [Desulfobacterales bacterium HSG2]
MAIRREREEVEPPDLAIRQERGRSSRRIWQSDESGRSIARARGRSSRRIWQSDESGRSIVKAQGRSSRRIWQSDESGEVDPPDLAIRREREVEPPDLAIRRERGGRSAGFGNPARERGNLHTMIR